MKHDNMTCCVRPAKEGDIVEHVKLMSCHVGAVLISCLCTEWYYSHGRTGQRCRCIGDTDVNRQGILSYSLQGCVADVVRSRNVRLVK